LDAVLQDEGKKSVGAGAAIALAMGSLILLGGRTFR
jgi:hypothetical protein